MPASIGIKDLPLRIGRPEEFTGIREFLRSASFDEANLSQRLSLKSMSDIGKVNWGSIPLESFPAGLRWCINVFIRGFSTSREESQRICGGQNLDFFCSVGLLRTAKKDAQSVVCPVWLYPCNGFLVISDRGSDPDGGSYEPSEDVVFPAIYKGTIRFLMLLPDAQGGEALDLCGGSGIGALHFSRTARTTTTADLTERSAWFAEFNGHLNGVPVESACGDLYGPVANRQFDVITAHPPFVPAVGPNMIYRDGGDTGEEVTRRVIAGLPAHLRPGGTCVVLCVARDTGEKQFEHRVSDWLGEHKGEFDIVFGYEKILSVDEVVDFMRKGGTDFGEAEAKQLSQRLLSFGTRQFPYGAVFIRRLVTGTAHEPLRLQLTTAGRAADFQRVLSWLERIRQPGFAEWLVNSRPRLASQLELTVRHVMKEGDLVPAELVFSIVSGFQAALRPDGWIVPLIARLNGTKSVRQVIEEAQAANDLPPGFTLDAFAKLVQHMIERGFLEAEKS